MLKENHVYFYQGVIYGSIGDRNFGFYSLY